MTIVSDNAKTFKRISLSNQEIDTVNPVDCTISNVVVHQPEERKVKSLSRDTGKARLKTNMILKGGKVVMTNVEGVIQ